MSVPGGGGAPELYELPPGRTDLPRSRSRLFAGLRQEGAKGVLIAVVSTIAVFAVLTVVIVRSPNWPTVRQSFFDWQQFKSSLADVAPKFLRNIQYFMIAEVFILSWALLLAVMRSLPGPVFFPLRLISIGYTDLFRGIPTILIVYLLGFGVPAMQLPGVPRSNAFWAVVALILSYSAYVAEVYRAGIESIHPSQIASARSLGLTRLQSLRFVVIPQAIRRVIPPLLNDFVGLQKDTALVAFVVAIPEAFKQGQLDVSATFNYTPLLAVALMFLIITIPMTRLVDWLIARERAKRQGGAAL
ncbi:MAG TPA: amino acid ABC transporter permease [Actinomycetota bacterium]